MQTPNRFSKVPILGILLGAICGFGSRATEMPNYNLSDGGGGHGGVKQQPKGTRPRVKPFGPHTSRRARRALKRIGMPKRYQPMGYRALVQMRDNRNLKREAA